MLKYEEVASGDVGHCIRAAFPYSSDKGYVFPARCTTGASPSPRGMIGVTAGPSPDWPTNGWPVPDPKVLAALRAALVSV